MVGQIDKKDEVQRALKAYIMRDREKQRLEDEAEAEKTRKKKELDEKKLKEESEFKVTKEKLAEVTKKHEQLQQDKAKIFEHLKKLIHESNKHNLTVEDLRRLYEVGLVVTSASTPSHTTIHPAGPSAANVIPRYPIAGQTTLIKSNTGATIPVQTMSLPYQKRNRSPSPTVHRTPYYKQAAGPHAFQKMEDSHRNREYKSYLFKPNQPGQYSAFYPPAQNAVYTMPSQSVHSNTPTYSGYGGNRENMEALHKSQQQNISSIPPPPSPSLYPSHRTSIQNNTPSSVQSNHVSYLVDHSKSSQGYSDDKYYMVRPPSHVPVHGVIPIHQAPQSSKHGSITSGYPVRPVATQISQSQLHMQHHGSGHHGSQSSHHSSQQPVHSSSVSSHHSSQSHHVSSQQSQNIGHQPHHQSQSVHYQPPHHPQSHQVTQPSQQSTVSVSISQQSHHHNPHHQQHIQQLNLQAHHPSSQSSSSHHQLIQHHGSPSIHHTSSQQHTIQQIHQQHHPPHSQAMHHSQIQQPHIQQHISQQSQQSQQTSVVTSQAYANQMGAIQGAGRVMYSQANIHH